MVRFEENEHCTDMSRQYFEGEGSRFFVRSAEIGQMFNRSFDDVACQTNQYPLAIHA
jgi:hypothetical protein